MTALDKTLQGLGAPVLRVLRVITILRLKRKEVARAKVIEFYIPEDFRKPLKWTPEFRRGKILEFCLQTKKSA